MVKTSNKRSPRRTGNKTDAAMTAANVEASCEGSSTTSAADQTAQRVSVDEGSAQPTAETTDSHSPAPGASAPSTLKPSTKLDTVVAMLERENGATVAEMMAVTSWQAHSVRGLLSGTVKKKLGLTLAKTKAADGQLIYRIVPDSIEETEDEQETTNSMGDAAASDMGPPVDLGPEGSAAFEPPADMEPSTSGESQGEGPASHPDKASEQPANDSGASTINPGDEA